MSGLVGMGWAGRLSLHGESFCNWRETDCCAGCDAIMMVRRGRFFWGSILCLYSD